MIINSVYLFTIPLNKTFSCLGPDKNLENEVRTFIRVSKNQIIKPPY